MECINCTGKNVITQVIPVNKRIRMSFKPFMNMVLRTEQFLLFLLPVLGWTVLLIIYFRGYKKPLRLGLYARIADIDGNRYKTTPANHDRGLFDFIFLILSYFRVYTTKCLLFGLWLEFTL